LSHFSDTLWLVEKKYCRFSFTLIGVGVNKSFVDVLQLGERGSGTKRNHPTQNFEELKNQCLEDGVLFEDPTFAADDSSLYFSQQPDRNFEWLRPSVS